MPRRQAASLHSSLRRSLPSSLRSCRRRLVMAPPRMLLPGNEAGVVAKTRNAAAIVVAVLAVIEKGRRGHTIKTKGITRVSSSSLCNSRQVLAYLQTTCGGLSPLAFPVLLCQALLTAFLVLLTAWLEAIRDRIRCSSRRLLLDLSMGTLGAAWQMMA